MIHIAPLPTLFRPGTSHVYPPFKKGRYLEEYVYEWLLRQVEEGEGKKGEGKKEKGEEKEKKEEKEDKGWVYLPVFWTHLQNHPGFSTNRSKYQHVLNQCLRGYPAGTRFFTCVQHDDGVGLALPAGTRVYGCCTGDVPLPLIYEDTTERLMTYPRRSFHERDILLSFVGTVGTHPVREVLRRTLEDKTGVVFSSRGSWSVSVGASDAERFLEVTARSRFCLAPRGYGRSSFRFFEAMLLDVVPVYVWDDEEWLPYKGVVPYDTFCISLPVSEISGLYERLVGVGEEEYQQKVEALRQWRSWFRLEGMCQWLCGAVGGASEAGGGL
jgi:hypothetical protein